MILICDGDWSAAPMTEQYALEQARALLPESPNVVYLAVPWSQISDEGQLAHIKAQLKDKRCVLSVCASPSLSTHIPLMSELGVTHLFWPYCRKVKAENPAQPEGMQLLPFPLYPETESPRDEVAALWQAVHLRQSVENLPPGIRLPGIPELWRGMLNPKDSKKVTRQLALFYGANPGCFIYDIVALLVEAEASATGGARGCTLNSWFQYGQVALDIENAQQRNLFLYSIMEALFASPAQLFEWLKQDAYLRLQFWSCCRLASPQLVDRLLRLQRIKGGLLPGFPEKPEAVVSGEAEL